jgi:hypothetical protein
VVIFGFWVLIKFPYSASLVLDSSLYPVSIRYECTLLDGVCIVLHAY